MSYIREPLSVLGGWIIPFVEIIASADRMDDAGPLLTDIERQDISRGRTVVLGWNCGLAKLCRRIRDAGLQIQVRIPASAPFAGGVGEMVIETWRRWLLTVIGNASATSRRKQRIRKVADIEQLESRTLLTAPTVVDDFDVLDEDTPLAGSVEPLGFDADGDPLTFAATSNPSHGLLMFSADGTFTYTPDADYNGPDSFTFKANDGTSDSNLGTFNLTVSPVNDAPVADNEFDVFGENEPTAGTVVPLVTDADADPLTFAVTANPSHGTLIFNADGTFIYTPNANYSGSDSFSFQANDGLEDSNVGQLNIMVNAAPVVVNDFEPVVKNSTFAGTIYQLASDANQDILTFAAIQMPAHGTLTLNASGTYTYKPDVNFSGTDKFTFKANDSFNESNIGTVNFSVIQDQVPVVTNGAANVNQGVAFQGSVATLGSDADDDTLTFSVLSNPSHGTLTLNSSGTFTYTPSANFSGLDQFSFRANDGISSSNVGTFELSVVQNQPPIVINGSAALNEDFAYQGTVATLATDSDSGSLTFSVVASPAHGTLTLNTNGTFTYTPNLNFSGVDQFTFKASDGVSSSNFGTFNLTVGAVDDGLKLTFSAGIPTVPRNSVPVRIDPNAVVTDIDTALDYRNTNIRALISSGNTNGDYQKGRVGLLILNQGKGVGLVRAEKGQIYYGDNNTSIGTYSGGSLGRALVIQFRNKPEVTEQAVNAVLRQISLVASKKATSLTVSNQVGIRLVDVTVNVGNQQSLATKSVSVI